MVADNVNLKRWLTAPLSKCIGQLKHLLGMKVNTPYQKTLNMQLLSRVVELITCSFKLKQLVSQ